MAFDAFLKIDKITDTLPSGQIELDSFSWGLSNPSTIGSATGGAGGGKISVQDFSFTAQVGKQTPKLFESALNGQHINNATLTVNDKVEPLTIHFTDIIISSYKIDESGLFSAKCVEGSLPAVQRGIPTESVSFNFAKIEFSAGGTTTGGIIG